MWREEERNKEKEEKEEEEKERELVIRQDTEQWVPFIAKNYRKCHLTLFFVFRNSQIMFSILVSHHSKTIELSDGNITE